MDQNPRDLSRLSMHSAEETADLEAFRAAIERKGGRRIMDSRIPDKSAKKRKKKRIILICVPIALVIMMITGYLLFVFSDIPLFKNWRTIWIETAMSTGKHHWLAEDFIPQSIIDEVMKAKEEADKANQAVVGGTLTSKDNTDKQVKPARESEDILGQRDLTVGQPDYAGYTVSVNDMEEGIVISEISGSSYLGPYYGKIALIDDPSRVYVGSIPENLRNVRGLRIKEMLKEYDAVLGINASGFNDPGGEGLGNALVGRCYTNGEGWGEYVDYYGSVVMTDNDELVVGNVDIWENFNIRDGIQFGPVLLANGEAMVEGTAGYGVQPRTAIGQRADGVIVMLAIDGRLAGGSVGCTVGDLVEILQKYNVINAACCDGGASSLIAYKGNIITNNCSDNPNYGRLLPNAWLVKSKKDVS